MSSGKKIWLVIIGVLMVALGVVCICNTTETLFATAWLIGCFTLVTGVVKMVFTLDTQRFMPNSGSRMLSALFEIIVGCIFLFNNYLTAVSLPLVFAIWVMAEGIIVAVQSFDYKRVGFGGWWCMLLLGIAAAVLGFFGMKNPDTSAKVLSWLIGIGVMLNGIVHIVAVAGINRFEKKVEGVRDAIDEAMNGR